MPAVELPYRAGVVPLRAAAFQARDVAFAAQTIVLSGLGGVGKTQLAADYAERTWAAGELDLLIWVTAGSREAIVSTYARVATSLTGIESSDPEQGARRLLEWLAATSTRWLVVLDDLASPKHISDLWPPTKDCGRVLLTTRRRDAALRGHQRQLIDLEVFTPSEAQTYIGSSLASDLHLLTGAANLARELGYLPLALAQATAYLMDRQLTCAAYRERFRRHRLDSLLPEPDGLPDQHQATVATTWSMSVEQADRLTPEGVARPLLEVACVLDANGIPANVFTTSAVLDLLSDTTERTITEEDARDGLGCLHRLSLITLDMSSPTRAVRVHALVQRATRDALLSQRVGTVTRTAADALLEVWPEIERDTALGQVLRANTDALAATNGTHLWNPDCHQVLFRSGQSLGECGLVADARDYFEELHFAAVKQLGTEHADTLTIHHELARWRGNAGDPAGALTALEQVLSDRLRILGPNHPNTLNTRQELAHWRGEAGNPAEAVTALEQLLNDQHRILGPDHPHTLDTRHNLAYWLGEAGNPAEAATALEQLLNDHLRIFGPDHPDTLMTSETLTHWKKRAAESAGD